MIIDIGTNNNDFRGKRAELNLFEYYAGFDCKYVINKSHKEGDITVIDDFSIMDISIVEEKL